MQAAIQALRHAQPSNKPWYGQLGLHVQGYMPAADVIACSGHSLLHACEDVNDLGRAAVAL